MIDGGKKGVTAGRNVVRLRQPELAEGLR